MQIAMTVSQLKYIWPGRIVSMEIAGNITSPEAAKFIS